MSSALIVEVTSSNLYSIMDATMQDLDSCLLLAQLDKHCLGQICVRLDPKHLALFGATCKPINGGQRSLWRS